MRYVMVAAAMALPAAAEADPVADFYKGRQVQMIIRTTVGGGYDVNSRLLARHIGRFIPGNPTVLPVNMPGGGGIVAANFIGNRAPKDGSAISIISQGLPIDQALGLNKSLQVDLRQLNWIGNMSGSNQVLVVWHTSATKSLADAKTHQTTIGATGAGSISVQLPAVYNNVLGTKFRIVFGYPGGAEIDLAMQRGEVDGRGTNPWADYKATTPAFVRDRLIRPLVQVGLAKDPDLPDVPLLRELATSPEAQAILDYMTKGTAVGRPLATSPGVPAERVAALRKAFQETLADPEFQRDAERQQSEVRFMSGEVLAGLVNDVIGAPQQVRDKVRAAIEPPPDAVKDGKAEGKKAE